MVNIRKVFGLAVLLGAAGLPSLALSSPLNRVGYNFIVGEKFRPYIDPYGRGVLPFYKNDRSKVYVHKFNRPKAKDTYSRTRWQSKHKIDNRFGRANCNRNYRPHRHPPLWRR